MSDSDERPDARHDAEAADSTPRSWSATLRTLPAALTSPQTRRQRLLRRGAVAGVVVAGLALAAVATLPGLSQGADTQRGSTAASLDRKAGERADRSGADRGTSGDTTTAAANPRRWVYPLANYRVTSCFGPRWGRMHRGVDLAWHRGEPIVAAHRGTVIRAGDAGDGYGRKVVIAHGNNTYTLYGHSSKVLVRPGQKVVAGQRIALVGSTGHSTGPHLHFEVHYGYGHRINPVPYLRDRGIEFGRC